MNAAVCPYCRGAIEHGSGEDLVCSGCGTPHHADCFAENGGCTVFGCSAAPAEEPKLHLTGSELAGLGATAASSAVTTAAVEPAPAPPVPPARVKSPPPPLPPGASPTPNPAVPQPPRYGAGSVLFGVQPVAAVATAAPSANLSFDPDPAAKNRMTFIVLGVLLGPFGAHNFYAGYKNKGIAQLLLTVLTLGLASPMSWVWAVIDVCTIDQNSKGVKFRS
jgi:TM2 domain-containing membrane protein YozV